MKYILGLTCVLICSVVSSQIVTDYIPTSSLNTFTWVTYLENDEVKLEVKRSDCDVNSGLDKQYFLIRITNKTETSLSVNWEMELFYNDDCKTCGKGEYQWQIDLSPNEIATGNCQVGSLNKLRMFSKFIDANYSNDDLLTGFHFKNMSIDVSD